MAENTREIVLDILLALEREEDLSHRLIRAVLDKYDYLEERDKAFIKRLAEGTIERGIELDYHLDRCSTVPVRKMKPLIRCLLRMSVYQLLYMDSVPDGAVCNEACKLAQKRRFGNLKGFVNGVLRNVARNKKNLSFPDPERNFMEYLSVRYSMPPWLVRMWTEIYGEERTEKILGALLEIRPVSLRFRTDLSVGERLKWRDAVQAAGVSLRESTLLPYVYLAGNTENIAGLPGYAEGKFVVQDAGSAMAVEAAGIREGDFVVDICAAPGGKSILAAEKAGRVLARDVSEAKTGMILENVRRMGMTNIEVETYDATNTDEKLIDRADVVLADVPCSGLGVLGRKRDIKYRMNPEKIAAIRELQERIIAGSVRYVRPGGTLLYSTCTINPEENEQTARRIAAEYSFELEEERQFVPGEDETDGFYYARLRRRG
ncbi:MAG: 16S rRNA (cytosine(967)-C(5))-methyltransferase RsmB [Clostridium sp.]|nr:16S rRNA (cytosine(967)-C(5))-methyltransferase RsmB [Acetatifactor muris]MCM1527265.1 16S rRNA (cytosine(967)-C(5))-methyltransferase RsmB [Bacteroides sp.]MCM1563041.1 16S rRNA (cytosine(967)-C(5))-methyltransferase RsmB [Clostridium sp.]